MEYIFLYWPDPSHLRPFLDEHYVMFVATSLKIPPETFKITASIACALLLGTLLETIFAAPSWINHDRMQCVLEALFEEPNNATFRQKWSHKRPLLWNAGRPDLKARLLKKASPLLAGDPEVLSGPPLFRDIAELLEREFQKTPFDRDTFKRLKSYEMSVISMAVSLILVIFANFHKEPLLVVSGLFLILSIAYLGNRVAQYVNYSLAWKMVQSFLQREARADSNRQQRKQPKPRSLAAAE